MLKINNLSKTFEETGNHQVIDSVNMNIQDGEFVSILGPSGSGKTVFLFLIAGFFKPSGGSIELNGKVVDGPSTDRMVVFQDFSLLPWRSVGGNIAFGLEKSDLSDKYKNELVDKYLDIVGLKGYKNWYPHLLSGGMKQRVAVARALISDPKILLLDEPFSALDPEYRKYMRKILHKIWQTTGKTMIFVTHSINEAIYLSDTIYLFSNLPARITKKYKIVLPRPRDTRSSEFINIYRDIEKETMSEFEKTLEKDLSEHRTLDIVLKDQINKIKI